MTNRPHKIELIFQSYESKQKRKDIGAINNPDNWKLRNEDVIKNLVDEFSIMFKLDNRRFDKVKFVDYINN